MIFGRIFFFNQVREGEFKVVVSELLFQKLARAPEHIKNLLDELPNEQVMAVRDNDEARKLTDQYLEAGIFGPTSIASQAKP